MHEPDEDFLDYSENVYESLLTRIEGFAHKRFSLEALAKKIDALLAYDGEYCGVVRAAVYNAMTGILRSIPDGSRGVSRIFGLSGEISGLYEIIVKRGTELEKIELGRLEAVNKIITDDHNGVVKEFDAVSSNTVFEFKFHLTLHKLYQQVVGGIGSAKMPHFRVLIEHPGYRHIRNLVYFGEYDYGTVTSAVARFVGTSPACVSRVTVSATGGLSLKLSLEEMKGFLFSRATMALAREEERHQRCRRLPPDFETNYRSTEQVIDAKLRQLNGEKFDVIIAVSNVPEPFLGDIKTLLVPRQSEPSKPAAPLPLRNTAS